MIFSLIAFSAVYSTISTNGISRIGTDICIFISQRSVPLTDRRESRIEISIVVPPHSATLTNQ